MTQTCKICSSAMSEPVSELLAMPSVTSDCRLSDMSRSVRICSGCGVMERVVNGWYTDPYKGYNAYPEPTGRTKKILEFVKDKMPEPKSVLDLGCGQGHGMKVMKEFFPDAFVDGYEPTVQFNRPIAKYDLITLFHVLEHVEDLHEMLAYIKSSLTENGHVLIQVPYAAMWPFDLMIADHVWHFNKESLVKLLGQNGFQVKYADNNVLAKEITLLAYLSDSIISLPLVADVPFNAIAWLLSFKSKLDTIDEPVMVYGSSVSAAWAGSILGDKVAMYLEDDVLRVGQKFNGKPIVSPAWVDPGQSTNKLLPVLAPFPEWQLEEIKAKNPHLTFL